MTSRKKKKSKGLTGNGLGPHHEISPMGHATTTPSRKGKVKQEDRRIKQRGWTSSLES